MDDLMDLQVVDSHPEDIGQPLWGDLVNRHGQGVSGLETLALGGRDATRGMAGGRHVWGEEGLL